MSITGPGDRQICKYFVQGACTRGDQCPFLHEMPDERHLDVHGVGFIFNTNVHNPKAAQILAAASGAKAASSSGGDSTLGSGGLGGGVHIHNGGGGNSSGLVVGSAGNGSGSSAYDLSLIHISEPTRLLSISYAVFCLKKKKKRKQK
eukprot:TRINITY_DN45898_c0_g1_i1.p1 TRINITY_DN45898_c0_g1~~TRINITY_DN45898_c0_g1_i1.p1  ORF type:complete len:147 (+),score=42.94 TRINITY_DN45898_c0_g1_i1:306-746(+)